jgi:hypothetical protein
MKITKVAVLIWLSASMPSFGAVESVLFHITTNETFTVPAGKVLIIESLQTPNPFSGSLDSQRLEKGTNSFTVRFDNEGVFGLLVSPSDLFASTQHRIDSIAINGGMASLDIQTASPRPAQINVEKSSEADNGWQAAENAVVTPTADKSRYTATVPVEGSKGFIRTKARPRER